MSEGQFPVLQNISQIRKAIEATKEQVGKSFYERTKNNHVIFNYRFFTKKTFPNPKKAQSKNMEENYKLLRECRGVVFDSKTGDIINRPFHKFFNINGELEECSSKYIDLSKKHYWLEKLDGSMISSIYDENKKIRFKTKMGYGTDVSLQVEKYVYEELDEKESKKYIEFSEYWIEKGYTPIFEFISPNNRIVLNYTETKLISIGIRNNKYGNYLKHDELKSTCETFDIHCVKNHDLGDNIDEIIKKIENMEGIEGFVLKIEDDDTMYKIKCDWYRNLHKIGPKITFGHLKAPQLWIYIINNELDDFITVLPKDDPIRRKLEDYAELLWTQINNETKKLEDIVENAKFKTSNYLKEYFQELKLNEIERKCAKKIIVGEDPMLSFIDCLKENLEESKKKINDFVLKMLEMKPFVFDENVKIPTKSKQEKPTKPKNESVKKEKITQISPLEKDLDKLVAFINGPQQTQKKSNKPNKKRRDRAKKQVVQKEEKIGFDIKIKNK